MTKLEQAFGMAGRWVKRNARPLEAARWELAFGKGSPDRVLEILSGYQNPDGGFGHGIEPDLWLPLSSPMSSWAAARILLEAGADAHHPMVRRLVDYLSGSQGPDGIWPSVLPENNEHPHAPWWTWTEDAQQVWMFNPSVELAGYLVYWSEADSSAARLGWETLNLAVSRLLSCTAMDMHEIHNYLMTTKLMESRAAEFASNTGHSLEDVKRKLTELVLTAVEKDPTKWGGYTALPLYFINGPESYLCTVLGDLVEENLKYFVATVDADGLWPVTWGWDSHPAEFAIASRHWQGFIALERYQIFKAFGWL